jgi:cell division protein FtsW (lipid II flippase)
LIALPCGIAYLAAMRGAPLTGVATAWVALGGAKLLAASASQGIIAYLSHTACETSRRGPDASTYLDPTDR